MAFSVNTPVGDGSTKQFAVNFTNGIFSRDSVHVFVEGEVDGAGDPIERTFTWINDGLIELDGDAPASGRVIEIRRIMEKDEPAVDFEDGEILTEETMDRSVDHLLNSIHELLDGYGFESIQTDINMNGNRVTGLPEPQSLDDAARLADISESASAAVLRHELGESAVGEGSDLVAHTGTANTVTESLDQNATDISQNTSDINQRVIYVGSVESGGEVSVSVPTDYATLQEAIDFLFNTYKPENQVFAKVNIETGHALTEGWRVENGDYSWIEVTSTDATVSLAAGFTKQSTLGLDAGIARTDDIGFLAINAKHPKFSILVDATGVDITQGIATIIDSTLRVSPSCGVINVAHSVDTNGTGCYTAGASRTYANYSDFSGAELNCSQTSINSLAQFANSNHSGSGRTGLDVSRSSVVYANEIDVSGCVRGIDVRRSWCVAQLANLNNCTAVYLWARLGAHVVINDATLDGTNPAGGKIKVEGGGFVSCSNATGSGGAQLTRGEINVTSFNQMNRFGIVVNNFYYDGYLEPVNAAAGISNQTQDRLAVAAGTYVDVLNISGPHQVLGGNIYGLDAGMRLTVDGVVVLNLIGKFNGEDNSGNAMAVVNIPPMTSRSSILIEAFNDSTVSRDYGWNVLYRPM